MTASTKEAANLGDSVVEQFYTWLVPNLGRLFDDRNTQDELSRRLKRLCEPLHWEVGPFDEERTFLAFSPNGDRKLLDVTSALAARAPEISGWIFLSGKPRKRWARSVVFKERDGSDQRFVMDQWLYSLKSFNDREFFDVELLPLGTDAPPDRLEQLGSLLVESELGERMFLEFIGRVDIVKELPTPGDRIEVLQDHVLQLLSRHPRH